MPNILVTGVNGFVGQHLVRELKMANCQVSGVGQEAQAAAAITDLLDNYYSCDLTSTHAVKQLPLQQFRSIINLAGLPSVGASFGQPELYRQVNVDILVNLGGCLLELGPTRPRLLAISSGTVYDAAVPPPFSETSALVPEPKRNPYVDSKIIMESQASNLVQRGLDCLIVRPFNHIGPGQLGGFLLPDLAQQIKTALAKQQALQVGNLQTQRDYTDVRDVVRAYRLLATTPKPAHTIYNVCSGQAVSGHHLLELLLNKMEAQQLPVEIDPAKLRPNDPPVLYGDHSRISQDCDWQPTIPLNQTIQDFVDWFKQKD